MRRLFVIFIILIALVACTKPQTYDSHGKPIRLSNYLGKWVIVNYWASWCVPCLRELPDLNRFYSQHKNTVVVLGVSFDGWSNDKINAFAKKMNIQFPMLSDFPKEKFGIQHIPTVPLTLIISPKGKLKTLLHGPQDESSLEKMISSDIS